MTEENNQSIKWKSNGKPADIVYENPQNNLCIWYFKQNGIMLRQMGIGCCNNRKLFNVMMVVDKDLYKKYPFEPRYNCRKEHEINLENGYKLIKAEPALIEFLS